MEPRNKIRIVLLITITITVIILLIPEDNTPIKIIIWLISSIMTTILTMLSGMIIYVSHSTITKIKQRYKTYTNRVEKNIKLSRINKCRQRK